MMLTLVALGGGGIGLLGYLANLSYRPFNGILQWLSFPMLLPFWVGAGMSVALLLYGTN